MSQGVDLPEIRRLVVGISGASGAILGIRLLEALQLAEQVESHLVISPAARMTITQETDWKYDQVVSLADVVYNHQNIAASIASGSFDTLGMVIIPCSIKTLSEVANSYSENLLSRAADVTLKEGRPLVLVVRETPLHSGHLRLMAQAAETGAVIFPPVPAFYSKPQTIDELVDNIVGRVLARLGVENALYAKWSNE
jgi:flavin prenyltransferase